jgi:hypothetical protein
VREGQGSFRGVQRVFEACGAALDDVQASGSPRFSGEQVVGYFLRPPRPSTVTGPGPSRTSPKCRFQVANHPSSALHDRFCLLRSVRTTAGSLAVSPIRSRSSELGHRDPASPGVRDLFAPPPTCSVRVHSRTGTLSGPDTGGSEEPRADGTTRPASFRPRGFAPPRRLPPHTKSRACCIPLPVLGFAAFHETRSRRSHSAYLVACATRGQPPEGGKWAGVRQASLLATP